MVDPDNQLNLPPELRHLIEKREQEDRRTELRRCDADRRHLDIGALGAGDVEQQEDPTQERRGKRERRGKSDRRRRQRRRKSKGDKEEGQRMKDEG